jgi:two-component system, chemotaxis family, protein-glutamate methylesterase/glutaminase
MSIRVLVVDDTAVFRRIVSSALGGVAGVEVVGTAVNGRMALAQMSALKPDAVTLDIEMPEMNGLAVLAKMRTAGLTPGVIMLSSLTVRGGQMTLKALELGAFDFVTKPEGGNADGNIAELRARLVPILRAFERRREIRNLLNGGEPRAALSAPARVSPPAAAAPRLNPPVAAQMVLIGISTGGPAALAKLVPALPANLGVPVFIVQHMPALFTQPLAASLSAKSAIRVKEAQGGETAEPNCAYVAPGGAQMRLASSPSGGITIRITDDPPENHCKPSVDYLFRSAALLFPGRAVAAILTGMGNDGTAGMRMLKRGNCCTFAQDEATCVVFGMPKEAIEAGVVDRVLPLDRMAGAIVRAVRGQADD